MVGRASPATAATAATARDRSHFEAPYNTAKDLDAYNRVQAVERPLGRVQNYVDRALAHTTSALSTLVTTRGSFLRTDQRLECGGIRFEVRLPRVRGGFGSVKTVEAALPAGGVASGG